VPTHALSCILITVDCPITFDRSGGQGALNVPLVGTRYLRSVTRSEPIGDRNTPALIERPIIAPRTRQANTVRERVMSCLMDGSTHNTSPEAWRGADGSGSRL
jgi:hypothetical protein